MGDRAVGGARFAPIWRHLDPIDGALLEALQGMRQPALNQVMQGLGRSGEHGGLWLVVGACMAAADRRRHWPAWIVVGCAGPISIGANLIVKRAVRRPRPVAAAGFTPLQRASANSYSFPSAHATSSFTAATLARGVEPRSSVVLLPLAVVVAGCRPYLGVHHVSDVLAGAAFGSLLGWLAAAILRRTPIRWRLRAAQ